MLWEGGTNNPKYPQGENRLVIPHLTGWFIHSVNGGEVDANSEISCTGLGPKNLAKGRRKQEVGEEWAVH